jgi:hypothetical protein
VYELDAEGGGAEGVVFVWFIWALIPSGVGALFCLQMFYGKK